MPLNGREQRLLREITDRLGGDEKLAEETLLRAGLRAYEVLGPALLGEVREPVASYRPDEQVQDVPGLEVLRERLGEYGLRVVGPRAGRPTMVTIEAGTPVTLCGGDAEEWGVSIESGERVPAALMFAARRSGNNAAFAVGSFLDDAPKDVGPAARPRLFFFVLQEERRVWVASRRQLQDVHARLAKRGKVRRITRARHGLLRLLFPKRPIATEIHLSVHRREG